MTLLSDLYNWAGQPRTYPMIKQGADVGLQPPTKIIHYADWPTIDAAGIDLFQRLNNYPPTTDLADFAHRAAWLTGELNRLHPFREGNGRTISTFLTQWSTTQGHPTDFNVWPEHIWTPARYHAYDGDYTLMRQTIEHQARKPNRTAPLTAKPNPARIASRRRQPPTNPRPHQPLNPVREQKPNKPEPS